MSYRSYTGHDWADAQLHKLPIASSRLLLVQLSRYFDNEGRAYPSVETLRIATGGHTSRGGIMRGLAILVDAGVLRRTHQGGRGRRDTCIYEAVGWGEIGFGQGLAGESRAPDLGTRPCADRDSPASHEGFTSESRTIQEIYRGSTPPYPPEAPAPEPSPSAPVDDLFTEVRKAATRQPDPEQAPMPDPPIAEPGPQQADMLDRTPSPDAMRDVWNAACKGTPVPQVYVLSDKRKQALRKAAALFRDDGIGPWETLVRWIVEQPWCRGEGDRSWVASLDWLLKGDNTLRYMEKVHTEIERQHSGSVSNGAHEENWSRPPDPELPEWFRGMFNEDGSWAKDTTRARA